MEKLALLYLTIPQSVLDGAHKGHQVILDSYTPKSENLSLTLYAPE
jgi:hypothetical protein